MNHSAIQTTEHTAREEAENPFANKEAEKYNDDFTDRSFYS
jgi:hypothetical protein